MNNQILKYCIEKGILLDKEVLDLLSRIENFEIAKEILEKINLVSREKMITKSFFTRNVDKVREALIDIKGGEKTVERIYINLGVNLEIRKERIIEEERKEKKEEGFLKNNLNIISSKTNVAKKLEVGDFIKYFRNRFTKMKSFLQDRTELPNLISINKIYGNKQASIIGMVSDKRQTKNKNILLEMEDLTGKIAVLINQNKQEVFDKAKDVMLDDVIGIRGGGSRDIFFANDLIFPEASVPEKKKLDLDEQAAFISDMHVGSRTF